MTAERGPWLVIQVSTETVYKQKAKLDSAGYIQIRVHVFNNNKEKAIKLRVGRTSEELKGGKRKEEIMELYCNWNYKINK